MDRLTLEERERERVYIHVSVCVCVHMYDMHIQEEYKLLLYISILALNSTII